MRKIKKAASVTWFRNFSVYVGERVANSSRLEFFLSFCFKTKRKERGVSVLFFFSLPKKGTKKV